MKIKPHSLTIYIISHSNGIGENYLCFMECLVDEICSYIDVVNDSCSIQVYVELDPRYATKLLY